MKLIQNTSKFYTLSMLFVIALITSCTSTREVVYFQDEAITNNSEQISFDTDIVYKPHDMLTITVNGDVESVRPFNLPLIFYGETPVSGQGSSRLQTYLIDISGNIEFPVLGTIKLAGLTRTQASDLLKQKISEYVNNPIVNIRLTNFTVTVLGEVNRPGTYTIADEKISLTEALGLAGDLTIQGKRENVFLIRDENGVKRFAKFDLTSINVVNSPNFYLRQDDVIYVEPNKAKVRSASYNQNNGIIISAVATLVTIVAILIR